MRGSLILRLLPQIRKLGIEVTTKIMMRKSNLTVKDDNTNDPPIEFFESENPPKYMN